MDVLTTIYVCLTLFSWLSNVKIQLVRVSLRENTASIQSKPLLGLRHLGCSWGSDLGTLWFCKNCSCTKVPITGSRQKTPADSLILDDLRSASQFYIVVGRNSYHGNIATAIQEVWFDGCVRERFRRGSLEESDIVDAEGVELGLEPWLTSKPFDLTNMLLVLLYALLLVLGIIPFVLLLCSRCYEMWQLNGDGSRSDAEIELLQLDDEH